MKKVELKKMRQDAQDVATGKVAPSRVWKVTKRADGTYQRERVDPEAYRKARVAEIAEEESVALTARRKMGVSQDRFAVMLGISASTLRKWEQKQRQPTGAAALLLRLAVVNPEAVLAVVEG